MIISQHKVLNELKNNFLSVAGLVCMRVIDQDILLMCFQNRLIFS